MNYLNELFYELIRVAINSQNCLSRQPLEVEWEELYKLAEKQSLLGICFVGLQYLGADADVGFAQIGMSECLYMTWMGMAAMIQQKNGVLDHQCAELQAMFSAEGMRSCILKGQGVAQLYGEELCEMRQSGDIDIWVDGGWERVMAYVNARTPNKEFDLKHTHYMAFDDTVVEVHWRPTVSSNPWVNKRLTAFFDREKYRQFSNQVSLKNGVKIWAPTADFQFIHAMLHVYNHFLYEGVGMRHMMDLYFALRSSDKKDRETIRIFLKNLGMKRFVGATQYVLHEVFGVAYDDLLCAPDKFAGNELLNEIMIGGNMGHYHEANRVKGESFGQRMKRRLKRRIRLIRFNPAGLLFAPIGKLRVLLWKKRIIRQFNL